MFLLISIVCLLHRPFFVSGELSKYSVQIKRPHHASGKIDGFYLPSSPCQRNLSNACTTFHANITLSETHGCLCSCQLDAATFGVKDGSWQCIDNKEIRERELQSCKRINFVDEKDQDPLEMFTIQGNLRVININVNTECSEKAARLSFQECDAEWTPLTSSAAWGVQVTKLWANSATNYMLKINEVNKSKELQGKVIRLMIPCGRTEFCLLFKVAGFLNCTRRYILEPINLSKTTTTSTTISKHPLTKVMSTTDHKLISRATTSATTFKAKLLTTYSTVNNSDIKTLHEASHEVPIALITGSVGSAVVVLIVIIFIGLLICRKRNVRHSNKTSHFLKKVTTETANQYSNEQTEAYQSLAPSPDSLTERGVYVSRYKVPNKTNVSVELSQRDIPAGFIHHGPAKKEAEKPEYDNALCNNVLKFWQPRQEEHEAPEKSVPYYHVLEVTEKDAPPEEQRDEACVPL